MRVCLTRLQVRQPLQQPRQFIRAVVVVGQARPAGSAAILQRSALSVETVELLRLCGSCGRAWGDVVDELRDVRGDVATRLPMRSPPAVAA